MVDWGMEEKEETKRSKSILPQRGIYKGSGHAERRMEGRKATVGGGATLEPRLAHAVGENMGKQRVGEGASRRRSRTPVSGSSPIDCLGDWSVAERMF